MPDKILIDAVIYQVTKTEDLIIVDSLECNAKVDYDAAEIKISNRCDKIGEGNKQKILMHEVIHAILHERGLDEESGNEKLVEELAKGFVNLIRQNPNFIKFIEGVM